MRRTRFVFLALCLTAPAAFAIVPNMGVDEEFSFVGRTGGGSVIAVGPNAVMTAKHITLSQFISFGSMGGGPTFEVDLASQTDIGGSDIRLYRTLNTLPGWYDIDYSLVSTTLTHDSSFQFTLTGNSFTELRAVGYGQTGSLNGAGTGYELTANSTGVRRQAAFFSDSRGEVELSGVGTFQSLISFLIDNGDGTLADQDSGGGLFRNVGGEWKLVGVNSFVASTGMGRLFGSGWENRLPGAGANFHFLSGFAELSPHQGQIEAFLIPEPASMAGLALAFAFVLKRRRR